MEGFEYMMHDDAFARLVADEVKNRVTDEQRAYLRLGENHVRWARALEGLLVNLDNQIEDLDRQVGSVRTQFANLGEDGVRLMAEMLTSLEDKRRKISRFRFYVAARSDEVTRLISASANTVTDQARMSAFLRKAIEQHRALINEHDCDYSDIDEALWAALDGRWDFDTIINEPEPVVEADA